MIQTNSMLWNCCVLWSLLAATALPQETARNSRASQQSTLDFSGGNAEEWINVLIESTIDETSQRVVDRLSYFHLSPAQVRSLKQASEKETSQSKRVVLWQALRQSRDPDGRGYLIRTLLDGASPEVQIQFIEQMKNMSRFDVPILVALYNSHRPARQAEELSQPTPGRRSEGSTEIAETTIFDVPLTIVEFTCHGRWTDINPVSGSPYPYAAEAPAELRAKYLAVTRKRSGEALLAQMEMIHWLIRNGFEESHRLLAYQGFLLVSQSDNSSLSRHSDLWTEMFQGLQSEASRAKAVKMAPTVVELGSLLDDPAEIVRLSVLENMSTQLVQSRTQSIHAFLLKSELFKPDLDRVVSTDVSVPVRNAAKRLRETISEFEKMDAKAAK